MDYSPASYVLAGWPKILSVTSINRKGLKAVSLNQPFSKFSFLKVLFLFAVMAIGSP